jgi:hypothetical protein
MSTWELILGLATSVGLGAYVVYAPLFPKNF